MTNWEHLFGTPERAIHTETESGTAQGRVRRRHRRVGGAVNRPGCNWGCLLFIAAAIAIDAAAIYAIRALALGLMAMAVAACG